MILLTDEQIRKILKEAMNAGQEYGDDGEPLPERCVAKVQYKKMVAFLKSKVVEAYGGNVIILKEDWEAITKEVEG